MIRVFPGKKKPIRTSATTTGIPQRPRHQHLLKIFISQLKLLKWAKNMKYYDSKKQLPDTDWYTNVSLVQ